MKLRKLTIKQIIHRKYILMQPHAPIRIKQFPIHIIRNSSPVLHLAHHILNSSPRVVDVETGALSEVLVDVEEGGFQVGVVEFVGDAETEGAEFAAFLND